MHLLDGTDTQTNLCDRASARWDLLALSVQHKIPPSVHTNSMTSALRASPSSDEQISMGSSCMPTLGAAPRFMENTPSKIYASKNMRSDTNFEIPRLARMTLTKNVQQATNPQNVEAQEVRCFSACLPACLIAGFAMFLGHVHNS